MTGTAAELARWLFESAERDKKYDLTEHKDKRHLSQNAYYWVLIGKLAAKLHISTARLHNLMLRDCAYPMITGGKVAMRPIPDTDEAENEVLEAETYHVKPTSGILTGNDGTVFRWYVILRGSSTFNVEEMSALIDRLIPECREQGIETLPDDEIERMRLYEIKQEKKKHSDGL